MGSWREAQDLRQAPVDDEVLDGAESAIQSDDRIGHDPRVRFIMSPVTVEFGEETWTSPSGMLLTDSLLVFARRKGLARRLQVVQFHLWDCPRYSQPTTAGIHWRVRFDRDHGGSVVTYFRTRSEADALCDYFASG